ncbi:hypothetical protein JAAARDRAFT_196781 [Jaapia argillacea MUCL 33604]|uniref:NADH:flavin oxidoreductase/NADH oxidase N-terminal domain-containing protein n=1 Tax=Jaapia argillacea MUCL 33604 TaxID=933084 RepID=A0A067PKU5_9AGAM|nr:hypothetical protein JAAARDRAFT_196781 [Jaapia argillacea MUCL 33604]
MGGLNKGGLTERGSSDASSDSDSTESPFRSRIRFWLRLDKCSSKQSDAGSDSTKHPNDGSEFDGSDSTKHSRDESDSDYASDSMNNSNNTNQDSPRGYHCRILHTEMTMEAIDQVVNAFEDAARRVKAGFDVVEINCGLGKSRLSFQFFLVLLLRLGFQFREPMQFVLEPER